MKALRYVLLSDGSSDRALIPHLNWLLKASGVTRPLYPEWAEFRHLREPPRGLRQRITTTIDLYPCDLVFIHRDAERESIEVRIAEIEDAIDRSNSHLVKPLSVCVVPVRMHEAWLLFSEAAIRWAAGNPNGRVPLTLPSLQNLEDLSDPKTTLYNLLKIASEKSGRRLRRFSIRHAATRVSQFMEDFSALRTLPAFEKLETDIRGLVEAQNWKTN